MGHHLSAKAIQSLLKAGKPGRYSDGEGLYLMIPKTGSPYWMLRYTLDRRRRELTLGSTDGLTLSAARIAAIENRRSVENGSDPIELRKRQKQVVIRTVDDLYSDWFSEIEQRLKHPGIPQRIYLKDISPRLGKVRLKEVSPMDVREIIRKIVASGRPTIANDALMYMKQLFNHAIKLDLLTYNPASAFNVNDAGGVEKSRDRILSLSEIELVFRTFKANADSFTRDNYLACALLLSLGVRKSELIEAPWEEIDLSERVWRLPATRSKSGNAIQIPLSGLTIEWLEELKIRACGSPYVFPNRRSSNNPYMGKDTLNRAVAKLFGKEPGKKIQPPNRMGNIQEFTVHDLRRTCRSLLASVGTPGHIAERCLNHKLKGVEGIYDRYDYFNERSKAIEAIQLLIGPLVMGQHLRPTQAL